MGNPDHAATELPDVRRRLAATGGAALLLPALLGGCSDETPDGATPDPPRATRVTTTSTATATVKATVTATATVTGEASPSPSDGPTRREPFPADLRADTQAHRSGVLAPLRVRIGDHDGFDRVVVDLTADGAQARPGWRVAYTRRPHEQGSGLPVDVRGEAVLDVRLEGVGLTAGSEDPWTGPDDVVVSPGDLVTEVRRGTLLEGTQQLFVGVLRWTRAVPCVLPRRPPPRGHRRPPSVSRAGHRRVVDPRCSAT